LPRAQCNRAVFGRFLRESKGKRPKTAMKKTACGFCGFVAASKCLDFSEIGIPAGRLTKWRLAGILW
jgi:hypothetical protein